MSYMMKEILNMDINIEEGDHMKIYSFLFSTTLILFSQNIHFSGGIYQSNK